LLNIQTFHKPFKRRETWRSCRICSVTYSSRPDYQQAVDLQNGDCSNCRKCQKMPSKLPPPFKSDDVRDNQYDNSCFTRETSI
jgi:hypothetical protein